MPVCLFVCLFLFLNSIKGQMDLRKKKMANNEMIRWLDWHWIEIWIRLDSDLIGKSIGLKQERILFSWIRLAIGIRISIWFFRYKQANTTQIVKFNFIYFFEGRNMVRFDMIIFNNVLQILSSNKQTKIISNQIKDKIPPQKETSI